MNGPLGRIVAFFASMKLAVVVLVLLGLLTWLGTLAQVQKGLFVVQKEYFEGWFVIADLPLSFWGKELFALRVPLPGAMPLMAVLFVNLIVGGFVRLRWSMRNVGVLITHLGIALLLVAGFVKLEYSTSGAVSLFEAAQDGGSDGGRVVRSGDYVSFHDYELALLRDDGATIVERTIPEDALLPAKDRTVTITDPDLPFRIELHTWFDNCEPMQKGPMFAASAPVVGGVFLRQFEVQPDRELNVPGCYVIVTPNDGPRQEGMLWGRELRPQTDLRLPFVFEVGSTRYALDLRRVMRELPFQVQLKEFRKTDHPGTLTPADYRSFVTVFEAGKPPQDVQIYMNTPLRREGFVLYQTGWGPQDGRGAPDFTRGPPWYSVFEAAENPSDKWPEYACYVIALGLVVHFLMKLTRFLKSSTREALAS
ncbi:MAG: cytochrome c biogenesis protein ResB [Planctomycetes bacterium]|nr:cytochrome c biogenesis protein ResB [Planctomycetota bacterium]